MMGQNDHRADFIDLRTRAEFFDLCGENDLAAELRQRSMEIAREVDINCYAYQLLWRGDADAAVELLHLNADAHPESWNVYDSLADVYAAVGNLDRSLEYYARAMTMVDDAEQAERIRSAINRINARRAAAELAS